MDPGWSPGAQEANAGTGRELGGEGEISAAAGEEREREGDWRQMKWQEKGAGVWACSALGLPACLVAFRKDWKEKEGGGWIGMLIPFLNTKGKELRWGTTWVRSRTFE